jgi:hypothetical protein
MRKLIFIFALLCCSTQAMAADPCANLAGKSLGIAANLTYKLDVGPVSFGKQSIAFTALSQFMSEPPDWVTGTCTGRIITFIRVNQGFTQYYVGLFALGDPTKVSGVYSQTGEAMNFGWTADVVLPHQVCVDQCKDVNECSKKPLTGFQCEADCNEKCP